MGLRSRRQANKEEVVAANGVVTAMLPPAAEAGLTMLRAGGNAVDAAIAAMLASFACEPLLTGLGAGGYMLIDVPGEDPVSYRLVEYMAVGACIVAYPHKARLHVPLVDREHLAYTKEDLSDLVELCAHYLDHPEERERLVANSRAYFDKYLHRDQLSAYHLHEVLARAV